MKESNVLLRHMNDHWHHAIRAVEIAWRASPRWMIANISLLILQGLLPLLVLYLLKLTVDAVVLLTTHPGTQEGFTHPAILFGLTTLATVIESICRASAQLVGDTYKHLVADHMQKLVHKKSVAVDLSFYENPTHHNTLYRAQQEAPFRPILILEHCLDIFQNLITLVAIATIVFLLSKTVCLLSLAASVPTILIRLRFARDIHQWQRDRTPEERRARYCDWLLTGDQFAKEVRLLDLSATLIKRFDRLKEKLRTERFSIQYLRFRSQLIGESCATFAFFGCLAYFAWRTTQGGWTIGDLVMCFQAFQRGWAAVQKLMQGVAALYEDNLYLSDLFKFLDVQPNLIEASKTTPVPRPICSGITFQHVSFRYPSAQDSVLEDIDLHIDSGKVVAFVGANGTGKSTLVKLLCRLYDPSAGTIKIDGIDLRDLSTSDLRRNVSVVFQDFVRFNATALENIWFGDIQKSQDDIFLYQVAQETGADNVISQLPSGYSTTLGTWFDEGRELSGGEWQKIALARAFFRDAQIVVLDEPTSSLDANTEYRLFSRFRDIVGDRIAILISHRFSTVKMADYIFVLKNGRVAEHGTHDQLITTRGNYSSLYYTQAQYYQ